MSHGDCELCWSCKGDRPRVVCLLSVQKRPGAKGKDRGGSFVADKKSLVSGGRPWLYRLAPPSLFVVWRRHSHLRLFSTRACRFISTPRFQWAHLERQSRARGEGTAAKMERTYDESVCVLLWREILNTGRMLVPGARRVAGVSRVKNRVFRCGSSRGGGGGTRSFYSSLLLGFASSFSISSLPQSTATSY